MKTIKILLSILLSLGLLLISCEHNDSIMGTEGDAISYNKGKGNTGSSPETPSPHSLKVYKGFKEFHLNDSLNGYCGGVIRINKGNGSLFQVQEKSFTPPSEFKNDTTVTITMDVEHDPVTNELVFTFGPHGSTFSPPAKIKLDYSSLNLKSNQVPNLYYIENNGEYVIQEPDQINKGRKFMEIYVHHFSRYAVAYSR